MNGFPSLSGGTYNPYHLNDCGFKTTKIDFDEDTHTYKVNDIFIASVSEIIAAVFGNKFAKVNPEVVGRAAKKGSLIHSQILDTLIGKSSGGFSKEYAAAIDKIKSLYKEIGGNEYVAPEQRLYCTNDVMEFCCTIDAFWLRTALLVDYKTSSRLDKANVTRQLNLYAYALRKNGYIVKRLEAWHLKDGVCKVYDIPLLSDEYCEKILISYRYGFRFKTDKEMEDFFIRNPFQDYKEMPEKQPYENDVQLDDLLDKIHKADDMLEKLGKAREDCVSKLFQLMQTSNRVEYERPDMKAIFVKESERKSLSTKLLKEQKPDLYDCLLRDFPKISKIAAHIRITYNKKENKNAD